jgi:hypothetical protein
VGVELSEWQAPGDEVLARLSGADPGVAAAFSAITAERLMRLDPQRLPFTQSLRPLLDLVWRAITGDSTAFKPIAVALSEFYISEYWHNDGQDGPSDADDDPAAAILYAAECYMHRQPVFATSVANRAIDAADYRVELASERYVEDEDVDFEVEADDAMILEAQQQLADLSALDPLAEQLNRAYFGLPSAERERLEAQLRAIAAGSLAEQIAKKDQQDG